MGFRDWISKTRSDIADEGIRRGTRYSLHQLWWGVLRQTSPLFSDGVNIFEKEWDVLILLDGCRTDALREVSGDYRFLSNSGVHRSTGSSSSEWINTSFISEYEDELEKTIYVTANQHANALDEEQFLNFDPVYRYGWDPELGTTPPDIVTNRSIELARKYSGEYQRMILHYMQPHFPSIPDPINHGTKTSKAWDQLWSTNIGKERLWMSYIANLKYVLNSVEILLENLDAELVVISSDHGNAMGEWLVYDHPQGLPISCLRDVPWYKTTANDLKKLEPDVQVPDRITDTGDLEKQLEALGYK